MNLPDRSQKGFEEYQRKRPESLSPEEFKKIAEKMNHDQKFNTILRDLLKKA